MVIFTRLTCKHFNFSLIFSGKAGTSHWKAFYYRRLWLELHRVRRNTRQDAISSVNPVQILDYCSHVTFFLGPIPVFLVMCDPSMSKL
jgi:hypothetical protein